MTRREYIHELIEPRNDSCISRLYDYVMLVVIVIGIFPLYSISDIGRVISIISSMVGIAIIALPSGIVTAGYLDELRNRKEKTK